VNSSEQAGALLTLIESDSRVALGVDSRNLGYWPGVATSRTFNFELEAFDVELRLAHVGLVETNVLHADKVLARWNFALDGPFQSVLLPRAPVVVCSWVAATQSGLVDLHPVATAVVALHTRRRRLADVNETGPGVLDELVVEQLETKLVPSLDSVRSGVSCCCTLVAAEVVGVHKLVGEGRVVGIGVLSRVRVLSTDGCTIHDQSIENVMRLDNRRRGGDECYQCELHNDDFVVDCEVIFV
jgi:hypothetical protein